MGSMDGGEDRTFKVNFTGEGAAKLRETVKEKLKEYMGDYTDDTLVIHWFLHIAEETSLLVVSFSYPSYDEEYVVVLLRNGRRKDEARSELDVFLGDDSDSFVSWLWDHLSTSLDLYVKPEETDEHDVSEPKLSLDEPDGRNISGNLDSGIESSKSSNLVRSRHNREWKGLVRDTADPPPLLSSEIEKIHSEEKPRRIASHVERSVSPGHQLRRKRSRSDDRHKRDAGRQVIDAPRRLLQFAVRDAVATSRPDSTAESALKRLRSVVSTSNEDLSLADRRPRIQSVALVPNPMATVIKAVAEAAEDVRKVKTSRSVFDRLSCGEDPAEPQHREQREAVIEDEEYAGASQFPDETPLTYLGMHREFDGDMTMMENDAALASACVSDYKQYGKFGVQAGENVSHNDAFGRDDEDLIMMHHDIADNGDDRMSFRWNEEQDEPPATRNTFHKTVLLPGSVSTTKPRHDYLALKKVPAPRDLKPSQQNVAAANTSDARVFQEKSFSVPIPNGNVKSVPDSQRTQQQSTNGLSARSMDNADLRTLFVNNVHVAATKDSLSQHFKKFGEVLKVIINTDAASGQPIGSAVIEFARKESADNALSLDGTSFMSRIIKVMKRSPSAVQKPTPATAMTRPRAVWGSPYARFPRVPFPRGIPGTFRARPTIRGGARSLQWKRGAQPTSSEAGSSASASSSSFNATPPFTARRFTYVRTEAKPEGNVRASAT